MPLIVKTCGESGASSVSVRLAACGPTEDGMNANAIVHDPPTGTAELHLGSDKRPHGIGRDGALGEQDGADRTQQGVQRAGSLVDGVDDGSVASRDIQEFAGVFCDDAIGKTAKSQLQRAARHDRRAVHRGKHAAIHGADISATADKEKPAERVHSYRAPFGRRAVRGPKEAKRTGGSVNRIDFRASNLQVVLAAAQAHVKAESFRISEQLCGRTAAVLSRCYVWQAERD